jgi:hypothetical protein
VNSPAITAPQTAVRPHPEEQMTAAASPHEAVAAPSELRITVVPTPQPPAEPTANLRLVLPGVAPPRALHRPGPRPGAAARAAAPRSAFARVWSRRGDLPDPHDAGRRVLATVLEALAGRRPLGQLGPLTTPRVYAALTSGRRPRWCASGTAPIVVGPVHVCEPVDGVAEVSAVAHRSGRAHAVAARLEGLDGRWRCTTVQIG